MNSAQFMIQFTLLLMDMRLDVRYSRSVANCVQMARRDLSTKTSFIEAARWSGMPNSSISSSVRCSTNCSGRGRSVYPGQGGGAPAASCQKYYAR